MEEKLIQQAREGDHEAFQQLVRSYHLLAWRVVCVLLPDDPGREDALQEAWFDVWRGLPKFRNDSSFRPWMLTIVAHRCYAILRRRKFSIVGLETAAAQTQRAAGDVLNTVLRAEEDSELHALIEQLPIEQRRVLQLRYFADMELTEIALVTGAPLGTVKSRLHRALKTLRGTLQTTSSDIFEPQGGPYAVTRSH